MPQFYLINVQACACHCHSNLTLQVIEVPSLGEFLSSSTGLSRAFSCMLQIQLGSFMPPN